MTVRYVEDTKRLYKTISQIEYQGGFVRRQKIERKDHVEVADDGRLIQTIRDFRPWWKWNHDRPQKSWTEDSGSTSNEDKQAMPHILKTVTRRGHSELHGTTLLPLDLSRRFPT